jgi:hypothetical protein
VSFLFGRRPRFYIFFAVDDDPIFFFYIFWQIDAGGLLQKDLLSSRSAASKEGEPQSALTTGRADECGG